MTQEQVNQLSAIHEHILKSNESFWPREAWRSEDQFAFFLERLLARAVGNRPVMLASATVVKNEKDEVRRFQANIFTDRLIFAGSIDVDPVTDGNGTQRRFPSHGDVAVIPRSRIRAVTLHTVDNFGERSDEDLDVVTFAVEVSGHAPIHVPMPRYSHARSGDHSRLFDALLDDLASNG